MKTKALMLALAVALAAAAGSGAALSRHQLFAGRSAAASNHCTRYAPAQSQDYNCTVTGTMVSNGTYQTPSVALRDSNYIGLSASRNWSLCYPGEPGGCASGTGTAGSQGASDTYRAAWCAISGSSVTGRCTTYWHD